MARVARSSGVRSIGGKFLILDDDRLLVMAMSRLVPDDRPTLLVHSLAEAQQVIDADVPLAAAVIDVLLPDGNGLNFLRALRAKHPRLPAAVLTGMLSPELVNEVTALNAQYICKPRCGDALVAFFRSVIDAEQEDESGRYDGLDDLGLSAREQEIVARSLEGVPRGRLAEVLGISENTLKKQIRSLLTKTGRTSLSEVMWLVHERHANGKVADR